MCASDGRERARMTYAECSHLYILRRAVRRNLRRCHRHSSPTYLPTAFLLPLHPPVARVPSTRSHSFLYFIVLSLSSAFPELSLICSLFSFLSLRSCFLFFFLPFLHFGNIKSRLPFLNRRISTFFLSTLIFFNHRPIILTSVSVF